jgi:hypothetical protein
VEYLERTKSIGEVGKLFQKGPGRVAHMVSVTAMQLSCHRNKATGGCDNSYLTPDLYDNAEIILGFPYKNCS